MKPTHEQEVMLIDLKNNLALPTDFRVVAKGLLENYDPLKHAELDKSIKDWNERKS